MTARHLPLVLLVLCAALRDAAATLPAQCATKCTRDEDCLSASGFGGTYPSTNTAISNSECGNVDCDTITGICKLTAWRSTLPACGFTQCGVNCDPVTGMCTGDDSKCTSGPGGEGPVEGTCTGYMENECIYRWCPPNKASPIKPQLVGPRSIWNVDRWYTATLSLSKNYNLFEPAIYTEYYDCLDMKVFVGDFELTPEEVANGELAPHWYQMCQGDVRGRGITQRTYFDPNDCEDYYAQGGVTKYLFISVEVTEPEYCGAEPVTLPDWASECDCFLRWRGESVI